MVLLDITMIDMDIENPEYWAEEQRRAVNRAWEASRPKLATNPTGVIIVFGTGGEVSNNDFNSLFYVNGKGI